jgi:hypothetical protein
LWQALWLILKIEHLGCRGEVDQTGAAVQAHIGEKIGFVNLTILGAGNSDAGGHFLVHQGGEIIGGAIPGGGLAAQIPPLIGPQHAVVDEEEINPVALGVGDLGQLKAPGRRGVVVFAQDEQEISHDFLLTVTDLSPYD